MSRANTLSFRLFRTLTSYHCEIRRQLITVGRSGILAASRNARKIRPTLADASNYPIYINRLAGHLHNKPELKRMN